MVVPVATTGKGRRVVAGQRGRPRSVRPRCRRGVRRGGRHATEPLPAARQGRHLGARAGGALPFVATAPRTSRGSMPNGRASKVSTSSDPLSSRPPRWTPGESGRSRSTSGPASSRAFRRWVVRSRRPRSRPRPVSSSARRASRRGATRGRSSSPASTRGAATCRATCVSCAPTARSARGARVEHDGRDVGEVTSAAADGGGSVALAVLARSVVPPASVTVVDEADRVSGEVLELPS